MQYWLIKSEPSSYSIDDLKRDKTTPWSGVRNFQARNFMRDDMKVGDLALFYHSSTEPLGIVGVATKQALITTHARQKKNQCGFSLTFASSKNLNV